MNRVQGRRRADRRRRHQETTQSARRIVLGTGVGIGATLAMAASADAQDFTVTNLNDTGSGSLRDSIIEANASPGADRILFQSGLSGTINVAGEMGIEDPVQVVGPGPSTLTLDGGEEDRIIAVGSEVQDPIDVSISGLTFKDGLGGGYGGAIDAYDADLVISNSVFTSNQASSGGAVDQGGQGSLSISGSTFTGNAAAVGGAVFAAGAATSIDSSTFNSNRAQYGGGAIVSAYAPIDATVTVTNSTFNRNAGGFIGGAIASVGGQDPGASLTVSSSTISGNQSTVVGGGIGGYFTSATINNSVVEGNFAYYGPDLYGGSFGGPVPPGPGCGCDPVPFDAAFTFVGDASGAAIIETVAGSNIVNGGDALLGRLADNGGSTKTMAIESDSPLVNKGSSPLTVDQRGLTRPVAYPGVADSTAAGANGSDIGAFELQYTAPPPPPPPPPPIVDRPFRILTAASDRKTGANTIDVDIPAAGKVEILGYGTFKSTSTHFDAKGVFKVKAVPKGKFRKRLTEVGRARHVVRFMYTPDVGRRAAKGKMFAFFKGARSGKAKAAAIRKWRSLGSFGR